MITILSLSPLLQEVQIGLFIVSGMLGLGALYGLVVEAENVSDEMAPLTSSAGKKAPDELRHVPRTPCNVMLEILDDKEQTAGTGRLVNISATGACFISPSIFLRDDPVNVKIPTIKTGANKLSGRVVWLRPRNGATLYGVRLNSSTPA